MVMVVRGWGNKKKLTSSEVSFSTREEIRTPDQLCVRQPLYH